MNRIKRRLPELVELERLISEHQQKMRVSKIASIAYQDVSLPMYALDIGSSDSQAPAFLLTGGVHGLERIGTRVILSYLRTILNYARWDASISELLSRVRFAVIPIVNPVGMYLNRRSNGNGVDLMRNSPVEAEGKRASYLIGGHRISPLIPWYRGSENQGMEVESKVVTDFIQSFIAQAPVSLQLDVHSGFGILDRIWFPYAKCRQPFHHINEMYRLNTLLDETLPNHVYHVEPQSLVYTTHGDLWDYIYDQHRTTNPRGVFIPLTLELGSWLWIKKNPRQIFSTLGIFNPVIPHRIKRILRRHLNLIDFLVRATASHEVWTSLDQSQSELIKEMAVKRWFKAA